MTAAASIDDLTTLDRTAIHVLVAGPGIGEGIAVALPGRGWIMVDSCRVPSGTAVPLVDLYERLRIDEDDRVELAVLTHPHEDHVKGFPDLLERTQPARVGVVGKPPTESLYLEAKARHNARSGSADDETSKSNVTQALNAIRAWETGGRAVEALVDGSRVTLGAAEVHCRAPNEAGVTAFFAEVDEEGLWEKLRVRANELSIVLEIVLGDASILLGADLPTTESRAGGRSIATGWNYVMVTHPHLGDHSALKIPHHGSAHARHPELLRRPTKPRRWVCTPFKDMPWLSPDGVGSLLEVEDAVHLTARPTDWSIAAPARGVVSYGAASAPGPVADPLLAGGRRKRPRSLADSTSHVWAFEFTGSGAPARMWAGDGAFTLVR